MILFELKKVLNVQEEVRHTREATEGCYLLFGGKNVAFGTDSGT
jgi:hypothetical protein